MEFVLPLGLGITYLVEKVGRELHMEGHKDLHRWKGSKRLGMSSQMSGSNKSRRTKN